MTAVVAMQGVTKSFGRRSVLRGLDLAVGPGEVVGVLGPNGAGKSTALRMLVNLVFRDGGSVAVHGLDPQQHSLAVRRRTAYLPGETALYASMTGAEFLAFGLGFHERRHRELQQRLEDEFALPMGQRVRTYSAGMKQKLALLVTLVPDVDLYVLDEPDRALDATSRAMLCDLLRELAALGKTIVLTSHHVAEIEAVARRVVFLIDGRSVPDDSVRRIQDAMRKEVRLRVKPGTALPPGTESVQQNPDGSLRIRTSDDPLRWVAGIPSEQIESLEVGATRLEAIYDALAAEASA